MSGWLNDIVFVATKQDINETQCTPLSKLAVPAASYRQQIIFYYVYVREFKFRQFDTIFS